MTPRETDSEDHRARDAQALSWHLGFSMPTLPVWNEHVFAMGHRKAVPPASTRPVSLRPLSGVRDEDTHPVVSNLFLKSHSLQIQIIAFPQLRGPQIKSLFLRAPMCSSKDPRVGAPSRQDCWPSQVSTQALLARPGCQHS